MKKCKQILEAVNRGIKFALDDFEDNELQGQTSNKINNKSNLKEYIIFQELVSNLKNKNISKQNFEQLVKLYKSANLQYTVNSKDELEDIIETILKIDINANLNWLDVSRITDMSMLFRNTKFNGDISKWDVFNVKDMTEMFSASTFNGDISNWNVSNVESMDLIFGEGSEFNGDISNWNVSHVKDFTLAFSNSKFNGDISNWNTRSATSMAGMFSGSIFNGDLSKWNVSKVRTFSMMFMDSQFNNESLFNWKIGKNADLDGIFTKSNISVNMLTKLFEKWKIELTIEHITEP